MDLSAVQSRDGVGNLKEAFDLAEKHLSVPKLLEPEGECVTFEAPGYETVKKATLSFSILKYYPLWQFSPWFWFLVPMFSLFLTPIKTSLPRPSLLVEAFKCTK